MLTSANEASFLAQMDKPCMRLLLPLLYSTNIRRNRHQPNVLSKLKQTHAMMQANVIGGQAANENIGTKCCYLCLGAQII